MLLLPILGIPAGLAHAQSGLQLSPDLRRVLVSKDVGAERWAISRDLGDGSVSGNVFYPGGGSPRFVWCTQTGSSSDAVMLSCSGSSRCLLGPCGTEAWEFVADVSLPLSFFAPRATGAALACHATAQLAPQSTSPPSGLQTSPGGGVTLVSKDVGSERWAIARQESDGSVTGNVFHPDGSDPQFVWCRQTGHTGGSFILSCQGADACGASCSSADWTFIAEVALPESFFRPREQASIEEIAARVDETLGGDDGFDAWMLAVDYGYALEQLIHAVADDRLERTGLIRLRAGSVEVPDGPARNVLLETPVRPASIRAKAEPAGPRASKLSIADIRRNGVALLDFPQRSSVVLLGATIDLQAQGYTLEQISEALYTGHFAQVERGPIEGPWDWTIFDENGQQVAPAGNTSPWVEPPAQPMPTPVPTPRPTPSPTPPGGPDCGNGHIDATEECDGANLAGSTCIQLGFAGGTLRCTARCTYDVTGCTELPPPTPVPTPPACQGFRCPDGICVPDGSDCCGGQRYCPPGKLCVGADKCCPGDASQLCGNLCIPLDAVCCGGAGYCYAGEVCVGGGLCCPANLPQLCGESCIAAGAACCPGGGTCSGGTVCTGVPDVCCPASFPQLCGSMCIPDGADCCGGGAGFCPPGSQCLDDGCSGYEGASFAQSVSVHTPASGGATYDARPVEAAPE